MAHQTPYYALRSHAVDLSRCAIAQRLVKPFVIVELKIPVQAAGRFSNRSVIFEIDLLVSLTQTL